MIVNDQPRVSVPSVPSVPGWRWYRMYNSAGTYIGSFDVERNHKGEATVTLAISAYATDRTRLPTMLFTQPFDAAVNRYAEFLFELYSVHNYDESVEIVL